MVDNNENYSFVKSFVKGEAFFGFWNVISRVLSASNSFVIISYLTLYEYGVYQLILSFYDFVENFLLDSFGRVVANDTMRFIGAKKESHAKKLFHEFALFRIIMAIILWAGVFFGAELIARYYDKNIAIFFKILSFLFIVSIIRGLVRMILMMRLKFKAASLMPIIYNLSRFSLLIGFVNFSVVTVKEILLIQVLANLFVIIVYIPAFIKNYQIWSNIKSASSALIFKIARAHGKWAILSPFVSSFSVNIQPWLVKFFVNTEAVAIFNIASLAIGIVKTVIPVNTLSSLIPLEVTNKEKMQKILLRGSKYFAIVGIVLALVAFFFVPIFVDLFFPKYNASMPLFRFMLLVLPIAGLRSLIGAILTALRRQKFIFFTTFIRSGVSFFSSLLLLWLFGLWGMAIEYISTLIIMTSISLVYISKIYPAIFSQWKIVFVFDREDKSFSKKLFYQVKNFIKIKI